MSGNEQQLIEHESIREPVNKLIKMRNRAVKRPKCRSKFVVMASVASALLFVIGLFIILAEFSTDQNENIYSGKLCD